MKKAIVMFLLPAAVLAGCGTADRPAREQGTVAWSKCTDLIDQEGKPITTGRGVECGTIKVPLDHAKPDGEKIDLALIRVKATTRDRLGSLVFNFGGPGASGVDSMAQMAQLFGTLGMSYDLVSFDPRGVERSAGVKCGSRLDKFLGAGPEADAERLAKEYVAACQKDSGKVLPYVGTVNAAKDLDLLRIALGDKKLDYFGISYGTHLGAVYATQFPENVGRFVLDSPIDPKVGSAEFTVTQVEGFHQSFKAFAKDCVAQGCDLGADLATVERKVVTLFDGIRAKPMKVGDRRLTYGLAQLGFITPLYSKEGWPSLEQGLAMAIKGDGRLLLAFADSYTGRKADGTYTTAMTSQQAIDCADTTERLTAAEVARTTERVKKIFSPLAAEDSSLPPCAHWPFRGDDAAEHIDASGSGPIVVIGTKGDPATPYKWSTRFVDQLKTGVLLTYEGEGHSAYSTGNECIKRTVDSYLMDGKLPARSTSCAA
ncbi:alpha/beta fold hydrolase [Nonomuraea sp. NPDC050451]|uniref:alpha/beta hydrolase n=1 Tax=Nonomuraea sp. NPDC050451 TaxID=3364364 RepID=UPI0037BD0174